MAIRNSIKSSADNFSEIHLSDELYSLLPLADILMVILPLTPKTEGLIGEDEINLLPEGSILVNVGRGKVVDQRALYDALKSKHLYGAGIDVWYNYPADVDSRQNTPPADYPFHELDNIVMSPHRAGGVNSSDTERLRIEHLAQLINHAARGEEIPNRVDVYKGY
jgi:phosphoglycerate dehydrogenase-like enzyme